MLTVLWHDRESEGYTDLLPDEWFLAEGSLLDCVHRVKGPRSGFYKAKCNVKVSGAHADLDYESFAKFNRKHEMYLGIMRVQFEGADRARVKQILFKDKGTKSFKPYSTTVAHDSKQSGRSKLAPKIIANNLHGAGFGTPEENKRVELAAMQRVTRYYKDLGWKVRDVSLQNRGYDLLCEKGAAKRHVEVKGATGGAEQFIITAREAKVWESDSRYVLVLVRNALSKDSSVTEFVGLAGRCAFMFQPIAYWAIRNSLTNKVRSCEATI